MDIDRETLLWLYGRMVLIRTFEDEVHRLFAAGEIPGFVHLYAGEEAVAVGVCAHLRNSDFITSTHRGHGHCIAKGVDTRGMMAELYGKATGVCKGKGGSMHIADLDKGMLGANGIVGGGLPLSCGPALAAKVKKTDQVTVCFFSDGATNQGTFHEALNLAAIWRLPVVFVCENNLYAESTPVEYSTSSPTIAVRSIAYGLPEVCIDGMDVFAVYETSGDAIARARNGGGPSLIEARTYRYYGHYEGESLKYRTRDEERAYKERDPIASFERQVRTKDLLAAEELADISRKCRREIDSAVEFARASDYPSPESCLQDVYVRYL